MSLPRVLTVSSEQVVDSTRARIVSAVPRPGAGAGSLQALQGSESQCPRQPTMTTGPKRQKCRLWCRGEEVERQQGAKSSWSGYQVKCRVTASRVLEKAELTAALEGWACAGLEQRRSEL